MRAIDREDIYYDLSNAEYHAHPAISKSGLDQINRSPAHYRAWLEEPPKETPATVFGTAFHMAILQPDLFKERYIQNPGVDRRTKVGKAEWEEIAQRGITILSGEDFRAIGGMRDSITAHPIAKQLIEEGKHELSGIWLNPEFDVLVKCRPDIWHEEKGVIADLKTTIDAREEAFGKSSFYYRYDVQAAFYRDIWYNLTKLPVFAFIFIAVEKDPPYAVKLYNVPVGVMACGRRAYRHDLKIYAQCLKADVWPAYPQDVAELELPRWAVKGE